MHPKLVEAIEEFTYHPDRSKMIGRMWGGEGRGTIEGHTFHVQLWWHGPDEDPGREAVLRDGATIEGWETPNGTYYDMAWYGYINEDGVWLRDKADPRLSELGNARFVQPPSDKLLAAGYTLVLGW